jgi:hypothetical protein
MPIPMLAHDVALLGNIFGSIPALLSQISNQFGTISTEAIRPVKLIPFSPLSSTANSLVLDVTMLLRLIPLLS